MYKDIVYSKSCNGKIFLILESKFMKLEYNNDDFLIKGTIWDGEKLYDLYKKAYTPWEWHEEIFKEAEALGYLEADPTLDVGGIDAGHKLALLA